MSEDPQRFAIDEQRWHEQVVPRVFDQDVVLPRHDDEEPMGALELLISSHLQEGVLRSPDGWPLHLINDDGPDCCGMIAGVRPTDPAGVMLSAGWLERDNFLPGPEELDPLDALPAVERQPREATLLHDAIDTVFSVANALLTLTERPRRAAVLGEVVLGRLPDGLSEEQLWRFAHTFDHSSIGDLVAECLAPLERGAGASWGGGR